jgi:2-methylcitrate dehydratase
MTIPHRDDARQADLLDRITDYVCDYEPSGETARETARLCLLDAMACALQALDISACARLLGPDVPGTVVPDGIPVPGTGFRLDPVTAAFDIGILIRWLDFNDTWLAAEWGHPSDNLGGVLAVADYRARRAAQEGHHPLSVDDVLTAMIKAYEIQGVIALENSFNRVGLDHVMLVKVATAAVATALLAGSRREVAAALSQAWIDGQSLRVYRHAPDTGPRKSWAAGDATSRGVRLALLTLRGEPGYPGALTTPVWGFQDVAFGGNPLVVDRAFGSYVIENILFKVAFPAEFHAQTAVECAFALQAEVAGRLDEVERVEIASQAPALRIIDKHGPLRNPADRDHCIQYMVAAGLIFGELDASHYEDAVAADPRIDALREKMQCTEDPNYSRDYLAPEKRAIANAVQVFFRDGSRTRKVEVEYPLGHPRRRTEALPLLREKFESSVRRRYPPAQADRIRDICSDTEALRAMRADEFMDLFTSTEI